MEELSENRKPCFSKDVTENGKTVTVFAKLIEDSVWELNILGKDHYMSVWAEWFSSPDEAIKVGLAAILEEGVDAFYRSAEFPHFNER